MTVIVRCDDCEKRYRVCDDRAGSESNASSVARYCFLRRWTNRRSLAMGRISLVHEARARDFRLVIGNEQNIEAISNHVERHASPVQMVLMNS